MVMLKLLWVRTLIFYITRIIHSIMFGNNITSCPFKIYNNNNIECNGNFFAPLIKCSAFCIIETETGILKVSGNLVLVSIPLCFCVARSRTDLYIDKGCLRLLLSVDTMIQYIFFKIEQHKSNLYVIINLP